MRENNLTDLGGVGFIFLPVEPVQCAAENADVVKALRLAVPVWSFAELEERPGQYINLYVRHRRRVKIE